MDIRTAEYQDYERIAHLHATSWKTYYQDILRQDYLDDDVDEDRQLIWQTRLTNPPFNQHVLLIEDKTGLLGFICLFGNHDFDKGTIIETLHIKPSHRNQGLGKLLIQRALQWVEQFFPQSGIYLEVMEDNQQAVDFYDHIGCSHHLDRDWLSPCGTTIHEWVYTWESPNELAHALEESMPA